MQVIEAQYAPILEPHEHLHIHHERTVASPGHTQIGHVCAGLRELRQAPNAAQIAGGIEGHAACGL